MVRRLTRSQGRWIASRGSTFSLLKGVIVVEALLILASCGPFRLHDAGRLKVATEAIGSVSELSSGGTGAFVRMEENLDAVRSQQLRLREMTNEHEFETYKNILPKLSVDQISEKLVQVVRERIIVLDQLEESAGMAAKAVNEALDRQKLITQILKDSTGGKEEEQTDLKGTLQRLKERLDWTEGLLETLMKAQDGAHEVAKPVGIGDDLAKKADEKGSIDYQDKVVKPALASAREAIKRVEKDERVSAALQLLSVAGQQVASAEQSRLLEMRRHLAGIERLRERLRVRDRISVCNIFPTALGRVYSGSNEANRQALKGLFDALRETNRYACLSGIVLDEKAERDESWRNGLAAYIAGDLKAKGETAKSPEFVAGLGILFFHERNLLRDAQLDLAREQHRHSILLSNINAQERMGLVHQLTQGLEIYYAGGIKPAQLAELVLLASQVGALTFIGSQQ